MARARRVCGALAAHDKESLGPCQREPGHPHARHRDARGRLFVQASPGTADRGEAELLGEWHAEQAVARDLLERLCLSLAAQEATVQRLAESRRLAPRSCHGLCLDCRGHLLGEGVRMCSCGVARAMKGRGGNRGG